MRWLSDWLIAAGLGAVLGILMLFWLLHADPSVLTDGPRSRGPRSIEADHPNPGSADPACRDKPRLVTDAVERREHSGPTRDETKPRLACAPIEPAAHANPISPSSRPATATNAFDRWRPR
jgi:hypothetical protein